MTDVFGPHVRAHIRLSTQADVLDFIKALCDGTTNRYTVESTDGTQRANARSLLGMLYASSDYPNGMYLVNETVDGYFPSAIDAFRI